MGMLDRRRRSRGTLSFDDVLVQLRGVVRGPGAAGVIDTLRNRFKVVLIDEFQDTDRVQWEIFSTLFGGPGDSRARHWCWSVTRSRPSTGSGGPTSAPISRRWARAGTDRYSLATNWRSDGAMLQALAALFDGATFGNGDIEFVPVDPGPANRHPAGWATARATTCRPWCSAWPSAPSIERHKNSHLVADSAGHAVYRDLAAYVRELLESAELPPTKDETDARPVRPSDIAVLVRTGEEGEDVQAALRRPGDPGGGGGRRQRARIVGRPPDALPPPRNGAAVRCPDRPHLCPVVVRRVER